MGRTIYLGMPLQQSYLPRPGRALRRGCAAGARPQAQGQGKGRERRAGGHALGAGAAAPPALLQSQ